MAAEAGPVGPSRNVSGRAEGRGAGTGRRQFAWLVPFALVLALYVAVVVTKVQQEQAVPPGYFK